MKEIFRKTLPMTLAIAVLSLGVPVAQPQGAPGAVAPKEARRPDVPYVPTPQEVVDAMLKLGEVKAGDTLMDLGSGDGRIVISAAKQFGTKGTGIDINPERIAEANENAKKAGVTDKVKFMEQDLFEADISGASIITLYLLPDINLKLRPKLWKDLKPGTRVVSHSFTMGDWKPDKEIEIEGRRLYLWVIKANQASGGE